MSEDNDPINDDVISEKDSSQEHSWYAVRVYITQEEIIASKILDILKEKEKHDWLSDVLVPITKYSTIKNGKERKVKKVVWPGYVLVKMRFSDDARFHIRNISGVFDFIGERFPRSLSQEEVKQIISLKEGDQVVGNSDFNEGDNIIISYGAFAKTPAKIVQILKEGKKVRVEISIFGRSTYLDMDWDQIEAE